MCALEVPAKVSAGLTGYTTDSAPLEARRHQVAKAIEELTPKQPKVTQTT